MDMEQFLTVRKAARLLDLPLHRVYDLCRGGVIPHVRLRRQIRIDPLRLRAFLDAGGVALPSESQPDSGERLQ